MAKHPLNPPTGERRVALAKRRRVAEMSQEEMQRELLTSEVTGLPNRRAFEEAGKATAVAMSDVDGLHALNKYDYLVGDAVLKAKADALREVGIEAYHDKGDEFLCRGNNATQLHANLERARALLRNRTIVVGRANGKALSITGADFSYGVGRDIHEAEFHLKRHKAQRENKGGIARGELRGITIRPETFTSKPDQSPTLT